MFLVSRTIAASVHNLSHFRGVGAPRPDRPISYLVLASSLATPDIAEEIATYVRR
jgi:hypothetical protein